MFLFTCDQSSTEQCMKGMEYMRERTAEIDIKHNLLFPEMVLQVTIRASIRRQQASPWRSIPRGRVGRGAVHVCRNLGPSTTGEEPDRDIRGIDFDRVDASAVRVEAVAVGGAAPCCAADYAHVVAYGVGLACEGTRRSTGAATAAAAGAAGDGVVQRNKVTRLEINTLNNINLAISRPGGRVRRVT